MTCGAILQHVKFTSENIKKRSPLRQSNRTPTKVLDCHLHFSSSRTRLAKFIRLRLRRQHCLLLSGGCSARVAAAASHLHYTHLHCTRDSRPRSLPTGVPLYAKRSLCQTRLYARVHPHARTLGRPHTRRNAQPHTPTRSKCAVQHLVGSAFLVPLAAVLDDPVCFVNSSSWSAARIGLTSATG